MSHAYAYQAIPANSSLFSHLRSDSLFNLLFARFFSRGGGPFHPDTFEDERANVLEEAEAEWASLGLDGNAEEAMERLEAELGEAASVYPGLRGWAFGLTEGNHVALEQLLARSQELRTAGLAQKLVYGDVALFSGPSFSGADELRLAPAPIVQQGAELLLKLAADDLGGDVDHRLREDYRHWRQFYLGAGERGDAVIVGTC